MVPSNNTLSANQGTHRLISPSCMRPQTAPSNKTRMPSSSSSSSSSNSPFLALGSGGRPIGSLLNPYDAVINTTRQRCNSSTSTASTPSLRSSACFTDDNHSCQSTPSIGPGTSSLSLHSTDRRSLAPSLRSQHKEEAVCFVWYHRIDLEKDWADVWRAFNAQFPTSQPRSFRAIQGRYYRYIYDKWKVPRLGMQKRGSQSKNAKYGLRPWTRKEYPWMAKKEAGLERVVLRGVSRLGLE